MKSAIAYRMILIEFEKWMAGMDVFFVKSPMKIWLVRHGQVIPPAPGAFYGGTEVPLSEEGEAQAASAGIYLANEPLDGVICSPLSRAKYGAQCVASHHPQVPVAENPAFLEIDRGFWVGLTQSQVNERFDGAWSASQADLEHWCGNGGESMGGFRDRVLVGLEGLKRDWQGGTVALVAHMFPIRAILAQTLGLGLEQWDELRIPTGSISLIDLPEGPQVAQVLEVGLKPPQISDTHNPT